MLKYSMSVAWSEADGEFVATSVEFPGLSALGDDPVEALQSLSDAIGTAVEAFEQDGEPVPQPLFQAEHSGQFRLRVRRSTHAALAARAAVDGVSLNSLVVAYIEGGIAADRLASNASRQLMRIIASLDVAAHSVQTAAEGGTVRGVAGVPPTCLWTAESAENVLGPGPKH